MTDSIDTDDPARRPESHRWGRGWAIDDRNSISRLIDDGVIGLPEEYAHFENFEEMAAFMLARGPYLDRPGFQPTRQDSEYVNPDAPANLDWERLRETYECLAEQTG
jgi:hypothetical protein